jgi:hypothetical protein
VKKGPGVFFAAAGCLFLASVASGVIGLILLLGAVGAKRVATAGAGAQGPPDGMYQCTMQVGAEETVIRKFSIAGRTYRDESFNQGSGAFIYDMNDRTLDFPDGPFAHHFVGLFAPSGEQFLPSQKYQFTGKNPEATGDTIRLLDLNTDYAKQPELGVPCTLAH